MTTTVTTACMILYDGSKTVYGVYRGELSAKKKSFNLRTAREVGRVSVTDRQARPSYLEMAERFATPDAPAFSFSA